MEIEKCVSGNGKEYYKIQICPDIFTFKKVEGIIKELQQTIYKDQKKTKAEAIIKEVYGGC